MPSNDPFVQIVKWAAELKRGSPDRYDSFVKSVRDYAERAKTDLLAASQEKFMGAQGKAQTLDELARKLENVLNLDEQYRTRT